MPTNEIKVSIMNRTGHTVHTLLPAQVEEAARDEMGQGKWANVISRSGASRMYTSFDELRNTVLNDDAAVADVEEVQLTAALTGGQA